MKPALKTFLSWLLPLIMIIGVFLGLSSFQKKEEGPSFPNSPPSLSPNFPPNVSKSQEEDFLKESEKRMPSEQRDKENMAKALKSGQVENCQVVETLELKQQCEDSLNYGPLVQKKDISQCQELHSSEFKEKCINTIVFQKAIESKNIKQCNVINDAILKTRCLDEIHFYLAQSEGTNGTCNLIVNVNQKTLCEDEMLVKTAISQNQPHLCQKVLNSTLKTQCLKTLESNQQQAERAFLANEEWTIKNETVEGLETCELLVNEARQKCEDEAYFQAAFEEKNLIYCNPIKNEEKKARCDSEQQAAIDQYYYKQALGLKKKNECYLINNQALETLCLKSFAL